jgi:hypothetical protein
MGSCNSKATGAPTQPGPVNTATAAKKSDTAKTELEEDVSIYFISWRRWHN